MSAWQTKTLGEVAQIERGKFSHRPRNEPRFYGGNTPFVQTGDVTRSNGIVRTHTQTLNDDGVAISKVFPAGTILITIAANIGYAGILKFDSAAPDSLIGLTPDDSVSAEFLNFYLRTQQPEMDRMAPKGTQKNINIEFLKPWPVIVPPLPEQKKIAHILSTVQRAIEAQERIIQTTTELKKALMHKLFTEGLRHEPQKQTEIGPVPESWQVKPLIETVEFIDYGVSQAIPKTEVPNGLKIVSTADIDKQGNLLYWKIRRIVVPERTAQRLVLKHGDVLFNWRNSAELIGKTAIFEEQDEPHIFASFILRICAGEKKSHNYFLKHLMNHYREEGVFVKLARRAVNQANYNKNEISVLKIPSPPYEQQVQIAQAIGAVEGKIWSHVDKKRSLEDLFRTLLHELMTAKIRVNQLPLIFA